MGLGMGSYFPLFCLFSRCNLKYSWEQHRCNATLSYWVESEKDKSYMILLICGLQNMRQMKTSWVFRWLRLHLPVQGTRVQSLVKEDPTCCGAAKPVCRSYWSPHTRPVLCSKRSRRDEKPTRRDQEQTLLITATREKPLAARKTRHSLKD